MTAAGFRRLALRMPEAAEGSHFGNPDFRVGGKIFATLALEKEGYGVLLLTPEQQARMVEDAPDIFSPVPGGWGRHGATRVRFAKVAPDVLAGALQVAWRRKAPKRLLRVRSA
ncbi:MAG: MmcQ/YjbR family DNA-binding protein [Candidatus Acidiferrales bacterium]